MASAPSSSNLEDETDEPPAKRPRKKLMEDAQCANRIMAANLDKTVPDIGNSLDDQGLYESVKEDLKQIGCKKNRGHAAFIRVADFSSTDLPDLYSDKDVVDLVTATSDLTCCLSVGYVSEARPEKLYPWSEDRGKSQTSYGTGWVSHVEQFTEEDDLDCECEECCTFGTQSPKKTWGEVYVKTARHVVYDDEEAKSTAGHFFYDSPELDTKSLRKLTRFKVFKANKEEDSCELVCATHDTQLLKKLHDTYKRGWYPLNKKVRSKYSRRDTQSVQGTEGGSSVTNVCIIVSHPHGLSKHVTVGTWTKRLSTGSYEYSTPTCPGSSGAPVIILPNEARVLPWFNYPAHSQGKKGGSGLSVAVREAHYNY